MPEEFKRQINTKIDAAVTEAVESSDTGTTADELQRKADTLRASLKKAITESEDSTAAPTEDGEITDDEWKEIFESLPADLLAEFGINTQNGLQDFVLGKEKLPDGEIKRIADEIIRSGDYQLIHDFFYETIYTLSQEDVGEIVYLLARAGRIDNQPFYYLEYFKDSPKVKDIFIETAKADPFTVFFQFGKISHYPWAVEILFGAAQRLSPEKIRVYVNDYADGLPDQEIISKILEIAVAKERSEPILRLLVDREYGAVQEYAIAQGKDVDKEKEKVLDGIMSDPALQHISDVKKEWVQELATVQISDFKKEFEAALPNYEHDLEGDDEYTLHLKSRYRKQLDRIVEGSIANSQAIVARNLYFQGKEVNEQNVKEEVQKVMRMREEYRNISIFSGRNVILAAHLEQKENDDFGDLNRFGKQALVDRIRQDGGNIDGVLRPSNTLESLQDTKQKILEAVKTTPPPFTFVFQGHGGPNALYLSDGQTMGIANQRDKLVETEKTVKITTQELFEVYKIRREKFGKKASTPDTRDIFIDGGCYNSNFVREFYIMCDEADVQKPIFTGESEYGQYGYSEYSSKYGDRFFDAIFNESDTQRATLGNIIDNDSRNTNSNPSLYIPTEGNGTMQLSRNEGKQTGESPFV